MKSRKIHFISLIISLMMVVSLAACGGGPATQDPSDNTGKPATTSDSEATGQKSKPDFELSFSTHDPINAVNTIAMQEWADEVFEKTNGGVKITIYPSAALASAADVGDMVETGGVDIGWLFTSFYKGQFPVTDVTTLPLVGFGDTIASTKAVLELYDKYEEVRDEWADYKVLCLYTNPGMRFAANPRPIKKPEDLKGLVLRTPAGPITDMVIKMGGSPVVMGPPDMYEGLSKNNIQGYVFEPSGIKSFKLGEVTDYFTDLPLYNGAFGWVMNKDKFESMPEEYQRVLEETTGKERSLRVAEIMNDDVEAGMQHLKDSGTEIITLTNDQIAEFQKYADEIAAEWPSTINIDGFDAAAFLEDAKTIVKKYNAG
jgi:TRAP-type C4-dicarboxylate transport system substrate-binding protein